MEYKIILSGKEWVNKKGCYIRGYAFIYGKYYTNVDLLDFFEGKNCLQIVEILPNINGCYSIIKITADQILIAVDRIRSIPLFYVIKDNAIYVSDELDDMPYQFKNTQDEIALYEIIKSSMYVCNNRTFYEDIKQLMCGQYLLYKSDIEDYSPHFYYVHNSVKSVTTSDDISRRINEVSNDVFDRIINSIGDKTIIVPLSGGYDSRYIISMLYKKRIKNVVCYSYGRKDKYEAITSKKVADKLGYKWFFVEYNTITWQHTLTEVSRRYARFCSKGCSSVHLQDFVALKVLQNDPEFPKMGVIMPGFCGDLLGGSLSRFFPGGYSEREGIESLIGTILSEHFNQVSSNNQKVDMMISKDIMEFIISSNAVCDSLENTQRAYEAWFCAHRASKYVVNSIRVYEFFGYEWRLPLWDNELIDLWYSINPHEKIDKSLYDGWLFDNLFRPLSIDIRKESNNPIHVVNKSDKLHTIARKVIAWVWLNFKIALRDKGDANGYKELAYILFNDTIGRNAYTYNININHITTMWYLEQIMGPRDSIRIFNLVTRNMKK